jgi:hypothetical protein
MTPIDRAKPLRRFRELAAASLLAALAGGAGSVLGEDWPSWRGPGGAGISREAGVPADWDAARHVRWRFADPGFGHSSPMVWKDALFSRTWKHLYAIGASS